MLTIHRCNYYQKSTSSSVAAGVGVASVDGMLVSLEFSFSAALDFPRALSLPLSLHIGASRHDQVESSLNSCRDSPTHMRLQPHWHPFFARGSNLEDMTGMQRASFFLN